MSVGFLAVAKAGAIYEAEPRLSSLFTNRDPLGITKNRWILEQEVRRIQNRRFGLDRPNVQERFFELAEISQWWTTYVGGAQNLGRLRDLTFSLALFERSGLV
jgi:hypothetical protein